MRSGVGILATPAEGVVGDWSTASRPIIVWAGAASEGGRAKNIAFEVPAATVRIQTPFLPKKAVGKSA